MRRNYHILGKDHTEELYEYLSRDGQLLLPLVELLETAEIAVDELIDIAGQSTIEGVLKISEQRVAGTKHQGKRRGKEGESLEERKYGFTLGGFIFFICREKIQEDYGIQRPWDFRSNLRTINSHPY
jgi:hypothetical protein